MLLVIDIGNSNIVMGTYEGKNLMKHWRISTDRQKTGDEYGMLINDLFRYQGVSINDVRDIIISSVVPPLVVPFVKMCERYFKIHPLVVGPGIKTGIKINYENPRAIESIVDEVIAKNGKAVEEYRAGKKKAIGALVGQIMKATKGKANPQMVNELLAKKLGG